MPVEKDALVGVDLVANLAMIAAWVGDKDLAFEQLESIIHRPSLVSYGELKLFPWWDPLRGDPRFEKILEEAKQPVGAEVVAVVAGVSPANPTIAAGTAASTLPIGTCDGPMGTDGIHQADVIGQQPCLMIRFALWNRGLTFHATGPQNSCIHR